MKSKINQVAILGLGLMGGSLAAAVRRAFPRLRVTGITRNLAALKTAKKMGWIHEGFRTLRDGVRHADLIVLCTPVHTFPGALRQLIQYAKPGAMVTDVGSVKGAVHRRMLAVAGKHLHYVSAHPMTGSHERGIQAVNPALYRQGFGFVIRDKKVSAAAYREVKRFWQALLPRVIEVSPEEHDRIVAGVSHLPHALAVCLLLACRPADLPYAASGFRDMTRLAAGSPAVWLPIFEGNRRQVGRALGELLRRLRRFQALLNRKNPAGLRQMLDQAAKIRSRLPAQISL